MHFYKDEIDVLKISIIWSPLFPWLWTLNLSLFAHIPSEYLSQLLNCDQKDSYNLTLLNFLWENFDFYQVYSDSAMPLNFLLSISPNWKELSSFPFRHDQFTLLFYWLQSQLSIEIHDQNHRTFIYFCHLSQETLTKLCTDPIFLNTNQDLSYRTCISILWWQEVHLSIPTTQLKIE